METNLWNLQVRKKGSKILGSTAKKSVAELVNYYPNMTKEEIEDCLISSSKDLSVLVEKYNDIDYEKAFLKTLTLNETQRIRLFEAVFRRWSKYNLRQLAKIVGVRKLIRIMTYVKNTYPNDYQNRVLKIWPALDNYI